MEAPGPLQATVGQFFVFSAKFSTYFEIVNCQNISKITNVVMKVLNLDHLDRVGLV